MTGGERTASDGLREALTVADSSARLQAALDAGARPHPSYVAVLVDRCAVEPDFFVREMLTWALTRHNARPTVERLIFELGSDIPQARSQALHTLSKIGDPAAWSGITTELLQDRDDDVARAAWRTAAGLVPPDEQAALAGILATQFGRGGRDVRRSLSQAFTMVGEPARSVVQGATRHPDVSVRVHAIATDRIMDDPDESFDSAVAEARDLVARGLTK